QGHPTTDQAGTRRTDSKDLSFDYHLLLSEAGTGVRRFNLTKCRVYDKKIWAHGYIPFLHLRDNGSATVLETLPRATLIEQVLYDAETFEAFDVVHPGSSRDYEECRFFVSSPPEKDVVIVLEDISAKHDGVCVGEYITFVFGLHDFRSCKSNPRIIPRDPHRTQLSSKIQYSMISVRMNDVAFQAPTETSILLRFRMYLTSVVASHAATHVPTAPLAGYISNFMFDGTTFYYPHADVRFAFPVSSGILVISFLHLDIDCIQGYLAVYVPTPWILNAAIWGPQGLEWKRCGAQHVPAKAYNVSIAMKFYSGKELVSNTGFKLRYSVHNFTGGALQLASGLFNCSVLQDASYLQHFRCNLEVECLEAEDEVDCPYSSDACGSGQIEAGDKCYTYEYVRNWTSPTWYDAYEMCSHKRMRLVSPETPEQWQRFLKILQYGRNSTGLFVGLQTANHFLGPMYRQVWQWADQTMAYYHHVRSENQLSKPTCAFMPAISRENLQTVRCDDVMNVQFLVCEIDKKRKGPEVPQLSSVNVKFAKNKGIDVVECPNHQAVIQEFLSCEYPSDCGAVNNAKHCRASTAGGVTIPMFVCDTGTQSVHYTM
ncbi:hypothetical protein BaRGS_00022998, partial [Batillaria attramentaria]